MSRMDEIIEIENRMEFYFQDLECDVSFTEEEIRQFHFNWQRLNQLDPPQTPTQKKRLILLIVSVIIICFLCFLITIKV